MLKGLTVDKAIVTSIKPSLGPAVAELQKLLDQSGRVIDVGQWIDALHHIGALLPCLSNSR